METWSTLVKMISDRENNFMQNLCNKWMRYRTFYLITRNDKFGIINNLFTWCRHDQNRKFKFNYKNIFLNDKKTN